jgi:DNA-binding IclR family transcriptional regulator
VTVITVASPPNRRAPVRIKRPSERRSISRSATRALDVLECFGHARQPLRAVDIGRHLGLHPSTTNQLLKTMVDSGHLVFLAKGKTYLPSPRLTGFGAWVVETFGADEPLRKIVLELRDRVGMMVTLSTANDLFMQVLDWSAPPGRTAERGLRISLFGSSTGSAYLSTLERESLIKLAQRARIPGSEMGAILSGVATIRREGVADGPSGPNLWSMAAPLPKRAPSIQLVLGLAGPARQVLPQRDTLKREMLDAIARWTD